MKTYQKVLLGLAAFVALVVFSISPLAKWTVNHYVGPLIGRELHVETVRINLFSGEVDVRDLQVQPAPGDSGRFLYLGHLYADLRMTALPMGRIETDSILVDHLYVTIKQQGERFNFSDIVERFQSDEEEEVEPEDPDTTGGSLPLVLRHIHLYRSHIHYEDLAVESRVDLNDISLRIPVIDLTDLNAVLGLDFQFAEGGSFKTEVGYDDDTHDFDFAIKVNQLPLIYALPYVRQYVMLDSLSGALSTELHLLGNLEHLSKVTMAGNIELDQVYAGDADRQELMRFDSIHVQMAGLDLERHHLHFQRVAVSDVSTRYVVYPDSTSNFSRLFDGLDPVDPDSLAGYEEDDVMEVEVEAPEDTLSAPWHLMVDDLQIIRIQAEYRDETMDPPFRLTVSDLVLQSHEFDTQEENSVLMHARVNDRGKLEARWRGRIDSMLDQYLKLSLTHLPLSDFSPYTLVYTGYPLTQGSISISSENTIAGGQLQGTNELLLFQPEVGPKDKSRNPEYKIPLKTALYLITDSKNCANLKLPVKGNIQSPRFSYKRLVVKAVFNVLGQAMLSPVAALARHSAKTQGLGDFIEINPHTPELQAAQYASLDQLAALWKQNPQLRFTLRQQLDFKDFKTDFLTGTLQFDFYMSRHPEVDREDLMFMDKSEIFRIDVKSKEVKAFVEQKLREEGMTPKKKYMDNVEQLYLQPTLSRLQRTMERRNRVVADYLTRSVHVPDSVFTIASDTLSAQSAYDGKHGYRIELTLPE